MPVLLYLSMRFFTLFLQALTLLLDFELIEVEDEKQQVVTALQTTKCGHQSYEALCNKKTKFREMVSLY